MLAKDGKVNDDFGWAVAISGNSILVGAPYKNNFTGQVYLFQRSGTTWTQQDIPQPKGVKAGDLLGWNVVLAPSVSPAATPAATDQANTILTRVNIGTIPSRSPNFQVPGGASGAYPDASAYEWTGFYSSPGANKDAGEVYFDKYDGTVPQSDVIPIFGDGAKPNDFVGAGLGLLPDTNDTRLWIVAPGNTYFGQPHFTDSLWVIQPNHGNGNGTSGQPLGGAVPYPDKTPDYIGANLILTPSTTQPGGSSGLLPLIVQALVNKSYSVTGLGVYSFGADGRIDLVDNESPMIGGVMYGYAGATNNTDIVLLGVDAKKKGNLGFFTIQTNKLVFGSNLPFNHETWQTVNPGGVSNFAFSSDGNTLVGASLDATTKTEAITVLEKN